MKIHPVVMQQNGVVSVSIQAQFIGETTDASDKQRIQAYGDPQVNLGGLFTDPSNTTFSFTFPASELYVGITTQMQGFTARFMEALPQARTTIPPVNGSFFPGEWEGSPGQPPSQGPLDCITTSPIEAATVWAAAIQTRVLAAMTTLRAQTPAALTSLPDQDI